MRYLLYIISAVIVFCSQSFAQEIYAGVDETIARTWGENKGNEILDIIASSSNDKYVKLDNILQNDVDIPYIAKFVVGKYWNKMTDEQKNIYNDLFEKYLLGIYKTFPIPHRVGNINFNISSVIKHEKYTDVMVPIDLKDVITNKDNDSIIDVVFRIHEVDGKIKLVDLHIAGSSLLITYRNKITDLILQDEEEIDWFLEDFATWIPSSEQYIDNMDSSADFE